ncbi:hypothetical protein [Variovorax guangxiensis]|uniref:Uncharacterized protein n=1 Tax=Variovorax guangxiensis TaxID=1775474 RepID=A0A502E2M5_9BURK|nr:hypothetical protein [Variovorax guangxiensis]RZL59865.1 MAG: hypothetical protein EOP75_00495 [Variovorax sp.]TPG27033.1 hypothetical protein EAH83_04655 [Variovorax ginsengisoli]TPG30761.1 hypothetical protein EAH82_04655 [Variovorax guangxiensis]
MKNIFGRLLLAFSSLFAASTSSHAFMVTMDMMALPAAGQVSNAVQSAGATNVATANKNSAQQVAAANANTLNTIKEAATNAKNIMEQALFFAKYPSDWIDLSKKYATAGTGWTSGQSTKDATRDALIEYDKYRTTDAAGRGTVKSLAAVYAQELEKYRNANSPYVQVLSSKTDTATAYANLLAGFENQMEQRRQRMSILSDMLNASTLQREVTAIGTLIAMEQEIGANQRMAFEMSRDMIRENAASTAQAPVIQRMAEFTDTRSAAPSASSGKSPLSLQRISFKN